MPCLIIALTKSAIKKTARKKTNNKIRKNKNFTLKTQYQKFKATNNNVKMQLDETLSTQILFFLTIQQMETFLIETS